MKNYKETILKRLNSLNEKAIALKNDRDTQLERAEKIYKGQTLLNIKTDIKDGYLNAIKELTAKERDYLNNLNLSVRKEISTIATKKLTDEEITDMEFIKAYGVQKMQDNPVLFNMYLDKYGRSFPFRALLSSEGIYLDNTGIPINEIDNLFSACDSYLLHLETSDTYASSLDSAVLLSENHGSISINGSTLDNFINTYTEG